MKLCRFSTLGSTPTNPNGLGIVEGDEVIDITPALDLIPAMRYPAPLGDQLIAHLPAILAYAADARRSASRLGLQAVKFLTPVANPTKICNAPINYQDHIAEANAAKDINHGRSYKHISDFGLFLKANSALIGFGDEVVLRFPDKRNDHELELAVIIGKPCNKASRADALQYVAGYSLGLDMTIRGPEQTCWRKSVDTYAVLGPWLVTADEIADPNALALKLDVRHADGTVEPRQATNTRHMVFDVPRLIEYASSMYTLYPGDIILTGTPAGVGPVVPGDVMLCEIEGVAQAEMRVANHYA